MKKVISLVLCMLVVALPLVPIVGVQAVTETAEEYFEDGSYLVVGFDERGVINDSEESAEVSLFQKIIDMLKRILEYFFGKNEGPESDSVKTKSTSKTKYANYYDANGNLLWSIYLQGHFSYDGEKAECTHVSVSSNIKDSDWKLLSADGTKEGATATGTFSVRQYKLGVPLKTIEKTLTLTCDKNGNIK